MMKTVEFIRSSEPSGTTSSPHWSYRSVPAGAESGTYVLLTEAEAEIAALRERLRVLVEALEVYKEDRCEDPIRERITQTKYKEEWILYDCTKCKSCRVRAALVAKEG